MKTVEMDAAPWLYPGHRPYGEGYDAVCQTAPVGAPIWKWIFIYHDSPR